MEQPFVQNSSSGSLNLHRPGTVPSLLPAWMWEAGVPLGTWFCGLTWL